MPPTRPSPPADDLKNRNPFDDEEEAAGNPFGESESESDDEDEDAEHGETVIDGESAEYKRCGIHSYRRQEGISDVIKEGQLVKLRAKDGGREQHYFILRADSLSYVKKHSGQIGKRTKNNMQLLAHSLTGMDFGQDKLEEELTRVVDLNDILVLPLARVGSAAAVGAGRRPTITHTPIMATVQDDGCTFRMFTREKSFFLQAPSTSEKAAWMEALREASSAVQQEKRGRQLELFETCPIRVFAHLSPSCQMCHTSFGNNVLGGLRLTTRRHHCRACGACVCENCSRERARIPTLDLRALFKVCTSCATELKALRRYGAKRKSVI
jgi:hypothetical protein